MGSFDRGSYARKPSPAASRVQQPKGLQGQSSASQGVNQGGPVAAAKASQTTTTPQSQGQPKRFIQDTQTANAANRIRRQLLAASEKPSSTESHESASHQVGLRRQPMPKGHVLKIDSILKQLKPMNSLKMTDLLHTSDYGRYYSDVEKFPTNDPQKPLKVIREIHKQPDIGNTTPAPSTKSSSLDNNKRVDLSYTVTDATFAVASAHYHRKDGTTILSAGPLKRATSTDESRQLGAKIADRFSALDGKNSMGISVDMETTPGSVLHRISVALHKSKENGRMIIVLNDAVKGNYECWGHKNRVESMLYSVLEGVKKHPDQVNQAPPLILDASDRNTQNDYYACGTASLVTLKELLKDDGSLIEEMAQTADEEKTVKTSTSHRVEVGLPPAIYRITQSPEQITDDEKSAVFRPDKGKTVQDKLNEFSLPNGKVEFSVERESFPFYWSEADVSRTVGSKGYSEKEKGEYTKTVDDPQNGYLRAKSLAYAQLAIDIAKEEEGNLDPKEKLQSMFAKIHIPIP